MAEDHTSARGKAPVTWHSLFPALVALWFGALFGLGVLAVRASLLESIVLATGIDGLISSAAPPLGAKARILIAFALALLGAAVGGTIGTLMARSKPAARARRAEAAETRYEAAEALTPQPEPVTAEEPSFIDIASLDLEDSRIDKEPAPVEEPFAEEASEGDPSTRTFARPRNPISFPLPEPFALPGGAAAARLTSATLDSLSHVELIERLALSLQKRREEAVEVPEADPKGSQVVAETAEVPAYYPPAPMRPAPGLPPSPVESPPSYASLIDIVPTTSRAEQGATPPAALRQGKVATERALRDALDALQRMSGAA